MNRQDECLKKVVARGLESDEGDGRGAASIFAPAAAPRLCLQPVYMRRFVCDGKRCGSLCCCAKWGVALDAATLARYEGRPELLHELKKGLERSEATGGWIMRHEDGRCVFLREDGLCSLHRRFGIGAISDVCAEYPRKMHEVGDTLDRALCLSCPVAAAEVLFSAAPLAFEWVELAAPRPAYVDALPLGAPLSAAAFRALQLACLALLQAENLALDARLAALGLLLARADAYVEEGAAEALTKDAAAIAEAAAGEAQALLAANPFDATGYLTFFLHLFPALAQATADDLPETAAYMAKIRAAFDGMPCAHPFIQNTRLAPLRNTTTHDGDDMCGRILPPHSRNLKAVPIVKWVVFSNDANDRHGNPPRICLHSYFNKKNSVCVDLCSKYNFLCFQSVNAILNVILRNRCISSSMKK